MFFLTIKAKAKAIKENIIDFLKTSRLEDIKTK